MAGRLLADEVSGQLDGRAAGGLALPRRRARLRRQGLDRAPARGRPARTSRCCRTTRPRRRSTRSRPTACCSPTGPGDPGSMHAHVAEVRAMVDQGRPLYGICLGHQLLGRALGLETFKLPFGHRGANHPVLETASGRVLVTSQNHGFAVQAPENGDGDARGHAPLALRRHGRGPAPARPRRSGACSSTPRPRRGRTTRARSCPSSSRPASRGQGGTADAAPRRSQDDRHHRLRPDRDRPGLRVRLLRRAGAQGAARGGLPHGPRSTRTRPRS